MIHSRELFLRSVERLLQLAVSVCEVRFGVARIPGEAPLHAGEPVPPDTAEPLARVAASQKTLLEILERSDLDRAGVPTIRYYASVQLVDEAGAPHGTFAVFDDRRRSLTKLQEDALLGIAAQVTRDLEMARRPSIDDLPVAQLAHEFNNVLMGIESAAEAIRRRAGSDAELMKFTDVITASLERGKRLTTDLLRFEPPAAPAEPLPESLRVLIVDDDEAVATGLRWLLDAEGMEAHVVGTGGEVLPAIETFRPDVVVLDLSLPDEDGRTVYERIAAQSAVPVVFSSGHVSPAELPELLGLARTRFLMKPYSTDALVKAIRELVPGRRE